MTRAGLLRAGRDSQDKIVGGESVKSRQLDLEACLAVDVAFHKQVAILLKAD
jgi:hypothetical protein